MDFNQLGTVIFAFGTTCWIPIWALFEGVAKCIRAFKGSNEEFRNIKKTEDLEENNEAESEEVNNTVEKKTRRTRTKTTKTEKNSSEQK